MDALPIDLSHPAVRDYLALVRLQVLTPLSLLINAAALVVCALLTNPTITHVARLYPTAISPHPPTIAAYVLVIFLGQLGYCFLLVLASKPETKSTLIKGVGLSLVFANWVMAFWAIACVFQWFLFATILQGLLLLLLIYSNIALLVYHPPTSERPIDTALIHAPLRFFLALPFAILFPYSLFVTLGLSFKPTEPGVPRHYSGWHAWAGFAVVMSTNLFALIVIAIRRDLVWCIAATWLCVSIWLDSPKPPPVNITVIIFTALHPIAFFLSHVWSHFYSRRPQAVALPPGDDVLHREALERQRNGTAREVDEEAVWGGQ
ncbi:hypothetical protein D9615_003245 [Tricholomella constricta]|uniref:Uncharacterized protein n=1 Tax=Tricholomella constricta TaxID=117010 RepID=A0A8H5M7F9_9AGAR|nr:hypothetical protein D9615_003245 [Tricholomella constricta]